MSTDEVTTDIVAEMRALVLLCVNGAQVPPSATIRATLNRWADEIERLRKLLWDTEENRDYIKDHVEMLLKEAREFEAEAKRLQTEVDMMRKLMVHCETAEGT